MDQEEIEEILAIIKAHEEHGEFKAAKHWPRRVLILSGVVVVGVIIQMVIENYKVQYIMHSSELVLASMIEAAFAKGREI